MPLHHAIGASKPIGRRGDPGLIAAVEIGLILCAVLALHGWVKLLDWIFEKIPLLWWPVYAIIFLYSAFCILILGGFI